MKTIYSRFHSLKKFFQGQSMAGTIKYWGCHVPRTGMFTHIHVTYFHMHTQKGTCTNRHTFHLCPLIVMYVCRHAGIHKYAHAHWHRLTCHTHACICTHILKHTQILSSIQKIHMCTHKTTIRIKYYNGMSTDWTMYSVSRVHNIDQYYLHALTNASRLKKTPKVCSLFSFDFMTQKCQICHIYVINLCWSSKVEYL